MVQYKHQYNPHKSWNIFIPALSLSMPAFPRFHDLSPTHTKLVTPHFTPSVSLTEHDKKLLNRENVSLIKSNWRTANRERYKIV